MNWDVKYDERVSKDIQTIGVKELVRIKAKIEWLSEHCDEIPHQSLEGKRFAKKFKLRVGDYRAIYSLNQPARVLLIEVIGHRSTIYKLK